MDKILKYTCKRKGCGKIIKSLYEKQLENHAFQHEMKHWAEDNKQKRKEAP